jgi:phosphoribosyl 1,2-cyclic phosphodiesterase
MAVLGSGSGGNSTLVQGGNTRVLVDAGFSARSVGERLNLLGVEPDAIDAIVVTHEHGDHTSGVGVFARRHATPIYMTDRTRDACARLLRGSEEVVSYGPGRPFLIGDLRVEPFLTVHDAADPVGIAMVDECTGLRLGIATDLGRPTVQIRHALSACDFLVLEANHDEVMLHTSGYPASVKRIRGWPGSCSRTCRRSATVRTLRWTSWAPRWRRPDGKDTWRWPCSIGPRPFWTSRSSASGAGPRS